MADRPSVVVRADASATIGTGHVMRAIALAHELATRGRRVTFAVRRGRGDLRDRIAEEGFDTIDRGPEPDAEVEAVEAQLGGRIEWLVVDHYGLDARWHESARRIADGIVVIDDLADRPLAPDVLVDPNLDATETKYAAVLERPARLLLGPRFAILRPEFRVSRTAVRPVVDRVERVAISLGGADAGNATGLALAAVRAALPDAHAIVVLGPNFGVALVPEPHVEVRRDVRDLARLLAEVDLVVGAGGTSALERCALGVPAVIVQVAANQALGTAALAAAGAVVDAGPAERLTADALASLVRSVAHDAQRRADMRAVGMQLVDGLGARRVGSALDPVRLRPVDPADSDRLLEWANDPETRRRSFHSDAIAPDEHERWLAARVGDPATDLLIGEDGRGPVGQVRFDRCADGVEISIGVAREWRGATGGALLDAAVAWRRSRDRAATIYARVKADNVASRSMFASHGFSALDERDGVVTYVQRPEAPA